MRIQRVQEHDYPQRFRNHPRQEFIATERNRIGWGRTPQAAMIAIRIRPLGRVPKWIRAQ
jgi:hypothetical protein